MKHSYLRRMLNLVVLNCFERSYTWHATRNERKKEIIFFRKNM